MGQYPLSFILIKWTQKFRMNPKLFLVAALACLFVDFSSATFPLTFASNGIWASPAGLGTASVADAVAPTVAYKQYSSLNNDYELTFYEMTEMTPCNDEDTKIPRVTFNFVQLDQLKAEHKDQIVDVIGICRSAGEIATINSSRTGKEYVKRDLQIVDQSLVELQLTLWGKSAETFNPTGSPVVAIKGCKVSDYSGVSLGALSSSLVQVNPDIQKCHELKGWYEQDGCEATFKSMSERGSGGADGISGSGSNIKTIGEVKSLQVGLNSDKGEYYSTVATSVMFQKDKALYQSCIQSGSDGKGCNKKVQDQGNGTYRCEKCNVDMDSFKWRLILSFSIADATDNQW